MSTHSLKEEYDLCFKLKVYVDNSSQVVSAWNHVRNYSAGRSRTGAHLRLHLEELPAVTVCYSAGRSRTGAHLRLHLEELPAVMVCDLRLDVSGLTVSQKKMGVKGSVKSHVMYKSLFKLKQPTYTSVLCTCP